MSNPYRARVRHNGQRVTIGYYATEEQKQQAVFSYKVRHGIVDEAIARTQHPAMYARYLDEVAHAARRVDILADHAAKMDTVRRNVASEHEARPDPFGMNAAMDGTSAAFRGMAEPMRQIADAGAIPANDTPAMAAPVTVQATRWAYCSDIHAPYHSREMLRRMVNVMQRRGVDTLIIGGDLLDLDSTSRHPHDTAQAGINTSLRVGGDILHLLLTMFDVTVLPGNHDRRVALKLDEPLAFDALIWAALRGRQPQRRLTITDYDYCYVGERWVVGHPRFYGKTPKALADVAQQQQRNVIGAHTHLQGCMWSADGKYLAIDPGCMCEAHLTPYLMRSAGLSRFPAWRKGYVIVENDIPTIYGEGLTDWASLGL